jgi:hypothetical protein
MAGTKNRIRGNRKPNLRLVGADGNAFAILGRATQAGRNAGWTKSQLDRYAEEATAGDYDNLLRVTMKYFNTK